MNCYSQQQNGIAIGTTFSKYSGVSEYGWVSGFYFELTTKFKTPYEALIFRPAIGYSQYGYSQQMNVDFFNDESGDSYLLPPFEFKVKSNKIDLQFDVEYNLNNYLKGLSGVFGIGFEYLLYSKIKYDVAGIDDYRSPFTLSLNNMGSNMDFGFNYNLGLASLELKYEFFVLDFNSFRQISNSDFSRRRHLIKIGILYFIDY